MSIVHVRHIRTALDSRFSSLIDVSDCTRFSKEQQELHFLTRALAAFSLTYLCEIEDKLAAEYITDGFDDNGIDAVFYDHDEKILYAVQSKWDSDGNGFPDMGSIQAFIKGFEDFLHTRWSRFNAKLIRHQLMLTSALDDPNVTLR